MAYSSLVHGTALPVLKNGEVQMKFTILAKDLKRALSTCNEIAPASSSIAEEKTGVLVRAQGATVVFMASDETSYVSVEVPAEVKEKGEALVRCGAVTSAISATFGVDENPIQVETTDKSTLKVSGVSTVKHNRTFPLLNAGFFIETPEFKSPKASEIKALDFQDGVQAVVHAASKDTSKLHFNCISVTFADNEVVFAATDGIQIAEFRKAAQIPPKGLRGSFILGLKFSNVVAKHVADILREGEGVDVVQTYVEKDNFFLRSGETLLVGTLLNTDFPDYVPFLETAGKLLAVFPTEEFLSVLSGMQPSVDAKSHRMIVDASKKGEAVLSTSSISGEAESSELGVTTPEDFTLHFDALLLQNSIRQLKGDRFEFYFTEEAAQVVLKSPKNEDFKALVCTLKPVN
jgi:DNA polymerase III sliding clamp (beta) subunit (PCNA family)